MRWCLIFPITTYAFPPFFACVNFVFNVVLIFLSSLFCLCVCVILVAQKIKTACFYFVYVLFSCLQIPSIYVEIKFLPVFIGIIAASFAFYSNFTMIFTGGAGKNGSTVAVSVLNSCKIAIQSIYSCLLAFAVILYC